jgi:hypothetical protein
MEDINNSWAIAHEKVEKFKQEVINPVFPNARFETSFMVGSPAQAPNSFEPKLSSGELFENTDYKYDGEGKYIHLSLIHI